MKKKLIEKEVFHLESDSPIPFKRYKDHLEDDDIVICTYEEEHYSENNSWDGFYYVRVLRNVLETDAEYEKRINDAKEFKIELKNRRRETYLKLKEEFENEI